jgi:hypothetical protein
MEATNSFKTLVIGTNQNIVISWKNVIFINTSVWTSDLPRKLIFSINRETLCSHNDWRYQQQFSWLLYSEICCHVSWYSSTLLTEKALPLKCWYRSTKLHDIVHRCGWWQDAIIAWCQNSHICLTLGCLLSWRASAQLLAWCTSWYFWHFGIMPVR